MAAAFGLIATTLGLVGPVDLRERVSAGIKRPHFRRFCSQRESSQRPERGTTLSGILNSPWLNPGAALRLGLRQMVDLSGPDRPLGCRPRHGPLAIKFWNLRHFSGKDLDAGIYR